MKALIEKPNETDPSWPNYTYEAALEASIRVQWRVEDLIGGTGAARREGPAGTDRTAVFLNSN